MEVYNSKNIWSLIENNTTTQIKEFIDSYGYHTKVYVTKINEKYFKYKVKFCYDEGIISENIELVEVKPVEKVIIDWVKI